MRALLPFQSAPPMGLMRIRPTRLSASSSLFSRRIVAQRSRLAQFKNLSAPAPAGNQSSKLSQLGKSLSQTPQRAPSDGRGRPGAGGARKVGLVWFRGDLRLHDNEALCRANSECTSLLPVYCFDPRDYQKSPQGYDRTGPYRATFLLEAVANLRERLRAAGNELLVRWGRPEEVLPQLLRRVGAAAVYCHGEVTFEGKQVEAAVKRAVEGEGGKLSLLWTNTLHHLEDLPFKLQDMPQNFDQWRQRTSTAATRAALDAPSQLHGLPLLAGVEAGKIPTLKELGLDPPPQSSSDPKPVGGESEALRQLRTFLAKAQGGSSSSSGAALATTAAAAGSSSGSGGGRTTGAACSSTFANNIAPWLATGCLSPRHMHEEARQALGSGSGGGSEWVNFELLWRDFFRFITLKYTTAKLGAAQAAAAQAHPSASQAAPAYALA